MVFLDFNFFLKQVLSTSLIFSSRSVTVVPLLSPGLSEMSGGAVLPALPRLCRSGAFATTQADWREDFTTGLNSLLQSTKYSE